MTQYIHKDGRIAKVVGYDKDRKTVRGCNGYVYYKEDLLKKGFIPEVPTDTEEQEENKEEPKDWIDKVYSEYRNGSTKCGNLRKIIEKHMPKPVGKELIPLDVKKCANEINDIIQEYKWGQDKEYIGDGLKCIDDIEAILSKYGHIQKQEEVKITRDEINAHFKNGQYPELIMKGLKEGDEDWESSYGSIVYYFLKERLPQVLYLEGGYEKMPTPTPQATSVDELVHKIYIKLYNAGLKLDDTKQQFIKEVLLSSLPIQKKRTIEEVEKYRNLDYLENEVKYTIQFLQDHGLLAD